MTSWQSSQQTLSRTQWDTCGSSAFSASSGHPLLCTLELGTLGIGVLGLAETHPILLDQCGAECRPLLRWDLQTIHQLKALLRSLQGRHESLGGHTWVKVASNSLQASLLVVESGRPASFHACTTGKEHQEFTELSPQPLAYSSVRYLRQPSEVSSSVTQ